MKNLSNFKLSNDVTTGFGEADDQTAKLDKISELEATLAKYKKLGRPKSEKPTDLSDDGVSIRRWDDGVFNQKSQRKRDQQKPGT